MVVWNGSVTVENPVYALHRTRVQFSTGVITTTVYQKHHLEGNAVPAGCNAKCCAKWLRVNYYLNSNHTKYLAQTLWLIVYALENFHCSNSSRHFMALSPGHLDNPVPEMIGHINPHCHGFPVPLLHLFHWLLIKARFFILWFFVSASEINYIFLSYFRSVCRI